MSFQFKESYVISLCKNAIIPCNEQLPSSSSNGWLVNFKNLKKKKFPDSWGQISNFCKVCVRLCMHCFDEWKQSQNVSLFTHIEGNTNNFALSEPLHGILHQEHSIINHGAQFSTFYLGKSCPQWLQHSWWLTTGNMNWWVANFLGVQYIDVFETPTRYMNFKRILTLIRHAHEAGQIRLLELHGIDPSGAESQNIPGEITESVWWLLMPWLIALPHHQQSQNW